MSETIRKKIKEIELKIESIWSKAICEKSKNNHDKAESLIKNGEYTKHMSMMRKKYWKISRKHIYLISIKY